MPVISERSTHPTIPELFKRTLATKRDFPINIPRPQPWLSHYNDSKAHWVQHEAVDLSSSPAAPTTETDIKTSIHLITWNIDFLVPWGPERMLRALEYLETDVVGPLFAQADGRASVVIMFQEMTREDIELVLRAEWVRRWFSVSDGTTDAWGTPLYGTLTLTSHALPIARIFRVPVTSNMSRDGLFVDVHTPCGFLRLCNLHLESLIAKPPIRPTQLAQLAPYLHFSQLSTKQGAVGALAAGDTNAIEPFDRDLASSNGLRDAYVELGGVDEGEERLKGVTWGEQEKEVKFPVGRLDKVFFASRERTMREEGEERAVLKIVELKRVGVGVKVQDEEVVQEMRRWGDLDWVSDHYGLHATFEITTPTPSSLI